VEYWSRLDVLLDGCCQHREGRTLGAHYLPSRVLTADSTTSVNPRSDATLMNCTRGGKAFQRRRLRLCQENTSYSPPYRSSYMRSASSTCKASEAIPCVTAAALPSSVFSLIRGVSWQLRESAELHVVYSFLSLGKLG